VNVAGIHCTPVFTVAEKRYKLRRSLL
jgi:hypothetical protein